MWDFSSPGKDWFVLKDSSKGVSITVAHPFVSIAFAALWREGRAEQEEGKSEFAAP